MADGGEVVGDEQVGEPEVVLELVEEVEDAGLDGDVEGADRLVEDDEVGLQGERAGDADPLALAAGELVGVAVDGSGVEADVLEQGADLLGAVAAVAAVDAERVGHDRAGRQPGVQRRVGVLVDDLHPRSELAQLGSASRPSTSTPSKHTRPDVAGTRRSSSRAVVDLPQPDSPTSAKV